MIIATFSVTGLNAAKRYDGDCSATLRSAPSISIAFMTKNVRQRQSNKASMPNATSTAPIAGSIPIDTPTALIIAFSSTLGNINFGISPCHNQMNATQARAHACISAIRKEVSGGISRSIHKRSRSKLQAVAQPINGRNANRSKSLPMAPHRVS